MEVSAINRLAECEPSVVSGLIEEHAALRLADAGPESWARDQARWRGVREALEGAAQGSEPRQRLADPPRWLQGAARAALEQWATSWAGTGDAMSVRILERLGLVQLEHDDTYVLAFVGGLVGDPRFAATTRADVLRADPDLRQAIIWRVFEVEGGGEVSLANLDKFCRSESRRWSTTFHELVDDATLARADVLSAALGALGRDFSAYRAGWFSRLYRSFEPTPAESAERQATLRGLLRSQITATVTMALRHLLEVARAGLLDDNATAAALEPALHHENGTTADTALRLAEDIAKRRPDLAGTLADQIAAALSHPRAKIQERAARLMQELGARERIKEHQVHMSPTVALALGLSGAGHLAIDAPPSTAARSAARPVDAAIAPVIRPAEGGELVELMAGLLEDASDPIAIEALLAGLARTGPSELLAPLDKRAAAILDRGPREEVTPGWLRGQLARLVRCCAGSEIPPLPWDEDRRRRIPVCHIALQFLARRIEEVSDVLIGRRPPAKLLATPAARPGWVEPGDLVTGLLIEPLRTGDLVAGLLRLAPAGRAEALAELDRRAREAVGADQAAIRAVRHALGAPAVPARSKTTARPDTRSRALWVAAARARDPLGADASAQELGLVGAGRAGPIDLRLGVPTPWRHHDDGQRPVDHPPLPWIIVDAPIREWPEDQPTAIITSDWASQRASDAEDYVPWIATLYPADAEHLSWVAGLDVVERALPYAGVRHDAVRVLDALRAHEGRIGRLTQAVLAAGLSAAGVDERVRAVDVVVGLAAAGRLDAAALGGGIADAGPITPLTRIAASLRDLASTGPSASELVIEALAAALPHAPVGTRGLHALLEVMLDEVIRIGRSTPPELRPWLVQFRGASRAAGLARRLTERV